MGCGNLNRAVVGVPSEGGGLMGLGFDPDGRASSGLFGLPHALEQARVVVLPVPVQCTTSPAGGAAGGPAAVLEASWQVDLCDP